MIRVPWTARRTNHQFLQMVGSMRSLMTTIRQRQLRYLGHVLKSRSLVKDYLLGMIEGTRARGRRQKKFMDGVKAVWSDVEESQRSSGWQKTDQDGATMSPM